MTRDELIAALEKAEGPSRELDARILRLVTPQLAEAVIGPDGWLAGVGKLPTQAEPYTSSIDAALTLVPEGWYWSVDVRGIACVGDKLDSMAYGDDDIFAISDNAATPALALCIAALKARGDRHG